MSSVTKHSVPLQKTLCISSGCNLFSEVICRHCHKQYCRLCFMSHRKYLITDMKSIAGQMSLNRQQSVNEVISFIDRQANDAQAQAKKLVDDAIQRIMKASENIHTYIENRRLAKLSRVEECSQKFDKDAELLRSKLSRQIFLPADAILKLRRKYAYNMFDTSLSLMKLESGGNAMKSETDQFFENYRYYNELMHLRQKWPFLETALTTVYFSAKKDISLDTILTFLEYRHDRVLENYREYLSTKNEEYKGFSSKSTEKLLDELSFVAKKELSNDVQNFSYIDDPLTGNLTKKMIASNVIEAYNDHCEEISSDSSQSWQIEDGYDY